MSSPTTFSAVVIGMDASILVVVACAQIRNSRKERYGRHRKAPSHLGRARARVRALAPAGVRARLDARDAARARRALERAGARVGIPVEDGDEPIRAWRYVQIGHTADDRVVLLSLFGHGKTPFLHVDDTAGCWLGEISGHSAPSPGCTCGFYALKYRPGPARAITEALAEVELFGVVIEHENGYRAERQRILSLTLSPTLPYNPADVANALGVEVRKQAVVGSGG